MEDSEAADRESVPPPAPRCLDPRTSMPGPHRTTLVPGRPHLPCAGGSASAAKPGAATLSSGCGPIGSAGLIEALAVPWVSQLLGTDFKLGVVCGDASLWLSGRRDHPVGEGWGLPFHMLLPPPIIVSEWVRSPG